jgi:hypothetical protein
MSILIHNDGSNPSTIGVHGYNIFINHKFIASFKHTREEGLATCLRKAADAVAATEVIKPVDHTTRLYERGHNNVLP